MNRRVIALALFAAALLLFSFAARQATVQAAPPKQAIQGDAQRGAYIFAAAAGCGCHITDNGFLAGGTEYAGPFGKVYSRNITPDPETGIGNWTEEQIVTTIRTGKTPTGQQLFPIMPYMTYSGMADQDAYDLAAYLKSVPPVKNAVPADQLNGPVPPFNPPAPPAAAPTEGVARGEYLVKNVADCSGCHTPTGANGAPDFSKFLAGGFVEGQVSANITPDNETGIGTWTEEQIANLLKTGQRPDGSKVAGLMAQVVEGGFSHLTDADRLAIAAYLKTIPAGNNVPKAPATLPATGGALGNLPWLAGMVVLGLVLLASSAVVWRGGLRMR
jgi:mono/diheme cytochrome c family protein